VVGHQTISVDDGAIASGGLAEILEELFPVPLALVDVFLLVASGCHMVKRPGKRNP